MSFVIRSLFGAATLQGLPIHGLRKFGVPPGGAFDQESYLLACALARMPEGALAVEFANASAELEFLMPANVTIVGAAILGGNRAFPVARGETLSIHAPKRGLCTFLVVAGLAGEPGDRLTPRQTVHFSLEGLRSETKLAQPPVSLADGPLRVVLAEPGRLVQHLTVSNSSNRTGIRLDGLPSANLEERRSEPSCVGAVQLTASGQLIVIGPDGPTIGGYPKVGFVCEADLDRLAHLRPGQTVEFEDIDLQTARQLARDRELRIRRRVAELKLGG